MAISGDKKFRAFDAALGRVVASKRTLREMSREQLAKATGMPLTNLQRAEAGRRSLSVAELEAIADAVRIPAGVMASEAVDLYGGIEKLMSEAKSKPADSGDQLPSEEELLEKYDLAAQEQSDETDPGRDEDPGTHTA